MITNVEQQKDYCCLKVFKLDEFVYQVSCAPDCAIYLVNCRYCECFALAKCHSIESGKRRPDKTERIYDTK